MKIFTVSFLLALSLCTSGCQAYSHWVATDIAGCDPVMLKQGVCAPKTAQSKTP
jgi:hypothetical protein